LAENFYSSDIKTWKVKKDISPKRFCFCPQLYERKYWIGAEILKLNMFPEVIKKFNPTLEKLSNLKIKYSKFNSVILA
jgi:hypothetical protein